MNQPNCKGLEVIFTVLLEWTPSGLTPGGAVFPRNILQTVDLDKKIVVLREDYKVLIKLSPIKVFIFQSAAPDAVRIHIHPTLISRITDLAKNRVLYDSKA